MAQHQPGKKYFLVSVPKLRYVGTGIKKTNKTNKAHIRILSTTGIMTVPEYREH